ncbi:unnamed protein product [Knipowitschia caucasica]|uniref:MalT-like TPR region domain-containing protein n=1 Tax=Knipowitschia caucasica TaxID=637954 RepID=A0AAV2JZU7_KNICA
MAARVCRAVSRAISVTVKSARSRHSHTHAHRSVTRSLVQSAVSPEYGGGARDGAGAVLWCTLAFSLFGKTEEEKRYEAKKKEDDMILLLKKAKLCIHRDQLNSASSFLHQAVALAQQLQHQDALVYCYSLMANLSFVRGNLDQAEKLFKASLSLILSRGTPESDNAVVEISLKLAMIYSQQKRLELAAHGFRFCVETLEEKLEKENQEKEDQETTQMEPSNEIEEQQRLLLDTRLLLGLALDSRARFWTQTSDLDRAEKDYRRSLKISGEEQGEEHPQTLVLLSDLASVLDLQGRHDEALVLVRRAVDLGRTHKHPDLHVLLSNMASILMHSGALEEAHRCYKEALAEAKRQEDTETVEQVQAGLEELKRKREERKRGAEEKERGEEERS